MGRAVVVDHLLQVGRQAVVLGRIHAEGEDRVRDPRLADRHVERVARDLGQLDRRRALPRHRSAVDDALRERVGHRRQRHLHRRRAERGDQVRVDARRGADLEALQILERLRLLADEVEQRAVVDVHPQQVHASELVHRVLLRVGAQRLARRLRGGRHPRQFEHLGLGVAAGGIGGNGPDDVGDAVARLVEQLRRRAAELHRRIDLALQPVPRLFRDLVAPGLDQPNLGARSRRQEVMHLQHHLLRRRAAGGHCRSQNDCTVRGKQLHHPISLQNCAHASPKQPGYIAMMTAQGHRRAGRNPRGYPRRRHRMPDLKQRLPARSDARDDTPRNPPR